MMALAWSRDERQRVEMRFAGGSIWNHMEHQLSPAIAAGTTDTLISLNDLAEMMDATLPKPRRRGT